VIIYIELSEWFKRYTDENTRFEIELKPGITALQAIISIGIPETEIGLITVGDTKVAHDHILAHGDKIRVYPIIIGG